jgi:hypothetical protein
VQTSASDLFIDVMLVTALNLNLARRRSWAPDSGSISSLHLLGMEQGPDLKMEERPYLMRDGGDAASPMKI